MRVRDLQVILAAERLVGYSAGFNKLRGPEDCNDAEFAAMWRALDRARGGPEYRGAIHHVVNYVDAWKGRHPVALSVDEGGCPHLAALVAEVGVWRFEESGG